MHDKNQLLKRSLNLLDSKVKEKEEFEIENETKKVLSTILMASELFEPKRTEE